MNTNETNAHLAAILETLADAHGGQAPGGTIAAALFASGVNEKDWRGLRSILIAGRLVSPEPNHLLVITERGREMVARIRADRAKKTGARRYRIKVRTSGVSIDRFITWKDGKIVEATEVDGNVVKLAPKFRAFVASLLRAHVEKHPDDSASISLEPA